MEFPIQEIAFRLIMATVLAGSIGIERQFRHKHAGFRTNGLVGLGSALMTLCGLMAAHEIANADPTRIASVVVQGIGFLCAGVIIQSSGAIRGVTTAATLWIAAGLGIACGFGFWQAALLAMVLVFVLLVVFDPIDARIQEEGEKVERIKTRKNSK